MTRHTLCISDYFYSFDRISVVVNKYVPSCCVKQVTKIIKIQNLKWFKKKRHVIFNSHFYCKQYESDFCLETVIYIVLYLIKTGQL